MNILLDCQRRVSAVLSLSLSLSNNFQVRQSEVPSLGYFSKLRIKMSYRVCLTSQPGYIEIEEPHKWQNGQVNAEYPKLSGLVVPTTNLFLTSLLGNPAPNMSLVFESGTGSVGQDGSPIGCYGSVHNNESDIALMPVEYPIKDYNKVNPVQVIYEGPLSISSLYKVDDKESIEYADILINSLKSFDMLIWFAIILTFFVFASLLVLCNSLKRIKGYSCLFETFCHMIGQESTNFEDRSGRLISFTITVAFFFILEFYLNLMSTELVVVNKPHVMSNYRDIIDAENMTLAFFSLTYDAIEFVEARKGTIQEEFWKKFKNTHVILDFGKDMDNSAEIFQKEFECRLVLLLNSLYSYANGMMNCKMKVIMQSDIPSLVKIYGWLSSDPEAMQHTTGFITRQGIRDDLIMKGVRVLARIFEAGILPKLISDSFENHDLGPLMDGTADYYEILKCMSKQLHYNQPEVERVNVRNFVYLNVVCSLLFLTAFVVLAIELWPKKTRVTPI